MILLLELVVSVELLFYVVVSWLPMGDPRYAMSWFGRSEDTTQLGEVFQSEFR